MSAKDTTASPSEHVQGNAPDGTRAAKLANIRSRFAEGSYRIDSDEIAAKLMDRLSDRTAERPGVAPKRT